MAKVVIATPEDAMKKWEDKYSKAADEIVKNATSETARAAYRKNFAKFLGLTEEDVKDEDEKRVESLKKVTAEALKEAVKGKGSKWYERLKKAVAG